MQTTHSGTPVQLLHTTDASVSAQT